MNFRKKSKHPWPPKSPPRPFWNFLLQIFYVNEWQNLSYNTHNLQQFSKKFKKSWKKFKKSFKKINFFGQVMSPRHSDHMSQWSPVSRGALWQCFSTMSEGQLKNNISYSRLLPGYFQAISRLYLAVHGFTWFYLAVHGCTWLFLYLYQIKRGGGGISQPKKSLQILYIINGNFVLIIRLSAFTCTELQQLL